MAVGMFSTVLTLPRRVRKVPFLGVEKDRQRFTCDHAPGRTDKNKLWSANGGDGIRRKNANSDKLRLLRIWLERETIHVLAGVTVKLLVIDIMDLCRRPFH